MEVETPEERLESSYQSLCEELSERIRAQVKKLPPSFFERLVVDVLVADGVRRLAGRCHAEQFAHRIPQKIVLINWEQLAGLMIDFGVGVTTANTYVVKKLDLDYFGEE